MAPFGSQGLEDAFQCEAHMSGIFLKGFENNTVEWIARPERPAPVEVQPGEAGQRGEIGRAQERRRNKWWRRWCSSSRSALRSTSPQPNRPQARMMDRITWADSDSTIGGNDTVCGGDYAGANYLYGEGIETHGDAVCGNDRLVSGREANDQMWGMPPRFRRIRCAAQTHSKRWKCRRFPLRQYHQRGGVSGHRGGRASLQGTVMEVGEILGGCPGSPERKLAASAMC